MAIAVRLVVVIAYDDPAISGVGQITFGERRAERDDFGSSAEAARGTPPFGNRQNSFSRFVAADRIPMAGLKLPGRRPPLVIA